MRHLSPRQRRAVEALLNGPISSLALRNKSGQLNSPDIIYRLRRNGFHIITERFKMADRDGKICRPAIYKLAPASRAKAIELIGAEENSGKAATNPERESESNFTASDTIKKDGGNQ